MGLNSLGPIFDVLAFEIDKLLQDLSRVLTLN